MIPRIKNRKKTKNQHEKNSNSSNTKSMHVTKTHMLYAKLAQKPALMKDEVMSFRTSGCHFKKQCKTEMFIQMLNMTM